MERDEISKILCRSGCGFYGSGAQDGLCSVCFKDALKKKCVPTSTTTSSAGSSSSSSSSSNSSSNAGSSSTVTGTPEPIIIPNSGEQSSVTVSAITDVSQSSPGPSISNAQSSEAERKPCKTKNRCDNCKKKVGLTGFDCRCGGLFCSLHRYSDKHDCSYNYREQGAAEIRRNNPQIMGQKINKI